MTGTLNQHLHLPTFLIVVIVGCASMVGIDIKLQRSFLKLLCYSFIISFKLAFELVQFCIWNMFNI